MANLTCWNYFAECLNRSSGTFINNASIFGKVYFPRLCVPVSIVISNIIKFGIQFGLFLAFLAYYLVRENSSECLGADYSLVGADHGGAWAGRRHHRFLAYHSLSRLAGAHHLRRATADVCHAGDLPALDCFRKIPLLVLANPMSAIVETFRHAFLGAGIFDPVQPALQCGHHAVILFIGILLFTTLNARLWNGLNSGFES